MTYITVFGKWGKALSCVQQQISNRIEWNFILIFLLAFISTISSFISSLSSIDFRLKIIGSCIQSCEIETLPDWKHPRKDYCNTCKCFISVQWQGVTIFFSIGNFNKLWKISIVAWSYASNTDWKCINNEGRYVFLAHVHRCSLNGDVQVVNVAEYTCKACQGHNELLIFKVLCYVSTAVSQKMLDFFAQLKNTSKPSKHEYTI